MTIKSEFQLKGHQAEAVETAAKRDGNILFSHPTGSGKTFTGIAAYEKLKDLGKANRVLVVTPASLRENYGENGVRKFTDSKYVIYGNKQEVGTDKTGRFKEPDLSSAATRPEYGVVSYELFRENPEKYIRGHDADTVIFDEVHRIKNDDSITYKALKNSRPTFRNFIGMTGSIVSNTPADIVPLIDAMTNGDHNLGSKSSFENRFVSRDEAGNKIVTNPLVVRSLLAPYVHHVEEDSIVGEDAKPKKIVQEIPVQLSQEHADFYRFVINQLDPLTKAKLQNGIGKLSKAQTDAIFAKLLKSRQVINSMSMLDKGMTLSESAERSGKVKRLLDDVEAHIATTPDAQVVVHSELLQGGIDVLEQGLKDRGIEYGKFIGKGNAGVTEVSRQKDVADYNAGRKKVILISSAGGEGLDLPNTTMVASLDGHWNPEKINQVEARGVRLGGLKHRPVADRQVLVNRYVGKLPLAKTEVGINLWQNISPERILERIANRQPAFFNPLRKPTTVDDFMYQVASQKAGGNTQLKSLFQKTSEVPVGTPYFNSDKDIMKEYLSQYQDQLLTGDYRRKRIDDGENRYIDKLRKYYDLSASKDVRNLSLKDYKEQEAMGKTKYVAKEMAKASIPAALFYGLPIALAAKAGPAGPAILKRHFLSPMGVFGSVVSPLAMYGAYKHTSKPAVSTPTATARKLRRLSDEELLSMLRGEAIRKEEVKVRDHYIKVK